MVTPQPPAGSVSVPRTTPSIRKSTFAMFASLAPSSGVAENGTGPTTRAARAGTASATVGGTVSLVNTTEVNDPHRPFESCPRT